MKIGIIVAMSVEFELVSALLENRLERKINDMLFIEGNVDGRSIVLTKSGIGKVCSTVGAMEMICNYQPDFIINTGVAGGIDTSLNVMDIVVGSETVYHDVWCGEENAYGQVQGFPLYFHASKTLQAVSRKINCDVEIKEGLICSGDKFITDREELSFIKKKFPTGLAVDMESCSIAQVCYMYNVPFMSFRIISDTPGVDNHIRQA
ncbi:5'-methylthioadenosine/adenosylhomocysteine nucleosidase [Porphyromonadaceae bacterium OttesenSCG-928-L07]|nr:5'-methylthioadenosine/adenosylhomocysteine nucleosidase [Porphyromonadaceae bacterium OttesenSCG-928-L07]